MGVICPNWHVLDNKAPAEFLEAIRENGCRVEKTPADIHQQNIAKQAIQTYKSHFIATMAGISDNFPIHQWHKLVPQIVLTLNLLQQLLVAPNTLAYAYHHGNFDYNWMPLAPMGCAVQFHIKPNRRKSWGEHASDGWYLKTSPDHYRCHWIFLKATRAKQISDTVFFKHKYITNQQWRLIILWSKQSMIWKLQSKETKIQETTHKARQSQNLQMLSCLEMNFQFNRHLNIDQGCNRSRYNRNMNHLPFILQGCRFTHLQGCGLTSGPMKSNHLMQIRHPNRLLSLQQLNPNTSNNLNLCQSSSNQRLLRQSQ